MSELLLVMIAIGGMVTGWAEWVGGSGVMSGPAIWNCYFLQPAKLSFTNLVVLGFLFLQLCSESSVSSLSQSIAEHCLNSLKAHEIVCDRFNILFIAF